MFQGLLKVTLDKYQGSMTDLYDHNLHGKEFAKCICSVLMQDLQKIEDRLKARQLPHQNLSDGNIVSLFQAMYWASVEEFLPAWENFLLGKGPHPTASLNQSVCPLDQN
uniref:Uncharacterized protein n=1 Tax=Acanthochromis polyacanthus TaxID=80966 RepID=A0A3Q1GK66_9TELE